MQTSPRLSVLHELHPECSGSRFCNREVDVLCTKSLETQRLFIYEREVIHKKTFTKWMNNKLAKADKPVHIKDLIEDLRDGHVLLTLLETLLSIKLPREKGKMRLHKLTNIKIVFEQLEQNGVKIVGINSGDIVDGMSRPILGLVWSIILRFQVHELFHDENTNAKTKDFHVEKRLLSWCQDVLDGYEDIIKLKDFTVGWRNGLAFNAMIHSHKPELFEFDDLVGKDNKANLQHAFNVAQNEFNVDPLLEPSDIDVPQPDKKLIMMYLTSMYDVLKHYEPTRDRKNKKLKLKMELEAYRSSYTEITLYMSQVETIVLTKLDSDGRQENPQEEHQIAKDLAKDTSNHVTDVNDVTFKGQTLIENGKISENDQHEIKTQIDDLKIRWEKLIILVSRLSKRCQTSLVVPKLRQVEYYVTWIRQTSHDVQQKGHATTPDQMAQELQDIEEIMSDIDENEPSIDKTIKGAEEFCDDDSIDQDVKRGIQTQLNVLVQEWEKLKKDTLGKQIGLQQATESLPNNEPITLVQDAGTVESAPPTSPPAYQVEVRRINVKSPPPSPRLPIDNQADEKIRTWKRKHDEARDVISDCEVDVKKLKFKDDSMQFNQLYEVCNKKIQQADFIVVDTVKHGQDLVKDTSLDEENIDMVANELENLVADYDDLLMQLDETKLKMDESVNSDQSQVQQDLEDWEVTRDELRPKISNCHVKLRKTKNKPIPYERVELRLYAQEVESCQEDVMQLEPEVAGFIDHGNDLLQNDRMNNNDKELVARNMHEIDNQFRTIKEDSNELKNQVEEVVRQEQAKKVEQIDEWKGIRDDLKPKISKQFVLLKQLKDKPVPFERVEIRLRGKEVKACHEEVTSLDPEVSRFMDKSHELIQGGKLDDDERRLVTKDMKDVDEQYEELRSESKKLKNKVEELIEKEDKKSFDLTKWRNWKHSIFTNFDTISDTIDEIKSISTSKNLDSLEHNHLLSKKCVDDLKNLEPEIQSALEFGQETRDKSPLTEDEKEEIAKDMEEMRKRYNSLKDDASNQNEWLSVYLEEQETSKADALERWQKTKQQPSDMIDACQSKVDALDDYPQTKEDLESELAKAKEYATELPVMFEEVKSCYDYCNTLLADDLLNQTEKDQVQHDAEEIGGKFKSLQSDVEIKQKRLQEQLNHRTAHDEQEAMRFAKLSEWRKAKDKLEDILKDFQRKFRSLQSLPEPKNVAETERRINNTADISENIISKLPEIQSGYEFGNELLNDDELTENDKDDIERDMEELRDDFKNLKDNVNHEHKRLLDLLEEFKEEQNKVQVWKDKKVELNSLLEKARKIVKDLKSRPEPVTEEEIDDQLDETQEIYLRMASGSIPEIDAGLSHGNQLLKDPKISDPHKDVIERDLETLEPAFKATREEFMNYYAWLQALEPEETITVDESPSVESQPDQTDEGDPGEDRYVVRKHVTADQYYRILHDELTPEQREEYEKQEKLHNWKNIIDRIDELLKRLMDKLNRLKSTDPDSYDDVKDHKEDAEDCIEEMEGSEPMIQESIRLGNDLLEDDEVDEKDKETIRVYIRSLQIKLRRIQDEADHEQERADKIIEDKFPRKTDEELIILEEPISEQYAARGDWDMPNMDEEHEQVPHSPLRVDSVDKTIHLKFVEKGPQKEYVMTMEDTKDRPGKQEPVDEQFHVSHRDKPDWDLNFSDGEQEDEITHATSDRGLPQDYFDNLHEDMTPEERRRAKKDRKMRDWQKWKHRLDDLIARLNAKLKRAKSADGPQDWMTIKEQKDEAEDCKEEIEESEPMIREAFDHCDDLLDDPDLSAAEKQEIENYVADAQIKIRNIHKDAADEEERLHILWINTPHPKHVQVDHERIAAEQPIYQQYSQRGGFDFDFEDDQHVDEDIQKEHKHRGEFELHFDDDDDTPKEKNKQLAHSYISILWDDLTPEQRDEARKAEKLENWRRWQDRLNGFLERQQKQLDSVSEVESPPDRRAVLELLHEATECKEEIEDSKPRVMHAVECANELLQDDELTDSEKDEIKQYVQNLEEKLQDIYTGACDEEDRLNELLEKYPRTEGDSKKLVDEEFHADHRERPHIELDFGDHREGQPDEVVHAMFKPSQPIHDYIWELHDDLDLDQRHEVEKREKLGRWRNWKNNLDDMLRHMNRRLDRVKETPKNRDDIIEQRDEAKELQEDVEESKPTLRKAIDSANELLADDDVSDDDKDDIRNYVEHLTIQLREIRDEAGDEEQKLNDLLDKTPVDSKPYKRPVDEFHTKETKEKPDWELSFHDDEDNKTKKMDDDDDQKDRNQKMEKWFNHRDRLNELSEKGREELLSIMTMDTPTNQQEVNQEIVKTEVFLERLAVAMPTIRESFDFGNDLLADDNLSENDKDIVEQDMSNIRDNLTGAKRNGDEHLKKLKDLRDEMSTPIKVEIVQDVHAEPEMDIDKHGREDEKFTRWEKSRDNLNDLLDQLKIKLNKVKTRDAPHNRKQIKERINEVKLCKEGVDGLDPEFKETLACAENILNDNDIEDNEKQQIKKSIYELQSRRDALRKQCTDENNSLGVELSQLDAEKSEKFSKWRKWRELVRTLVDNHNGKLNKVKNSKTPKNRKAIEEQLTVLKECEDGLRTSAPEMQFALDYGRHLSDDDILDENEQKTVKQETGKFEKDLNDLKVDVEKEKERLNDALDKFDAVIRDKLSKWNDKKRSVKPSLDKLQNKVGVLKFKLKPRNKQGILERMAEVEDCKTELKYIEPKVKDCIKYGNDLLHEQNLDKGSTETVKDDLDELKQDLDKLNQDIADQQTSMKKLSEEEDQIKKEKQKKYRDWRKEIQELLQTLKGKLKRLPKSDKETPKDDAKKDELTDLAKECSRDLDKLEEEVKDLKDYGNGLIDDGNLNDKETREIKDDIVKLEDELKNVKKDNDVIKTTIAEMNEQHPSASDHPDMEQWRERVKKVFIGLDLAEDRLFETSDLNTRVEIKERLDEVREINIGFEESEPDFLETIDFGKELLEKEDIPDNNKEEIKEDLISMAKQWGKLKSEGQDKEQSLEDQLLSSSDQSDDLVNWHERCDDMQAWVDDTLALLETRPVSLSASFGNMKRQQTVTEDILEELVQKQVQINDVIDDGNRLLDDQTCGTDEKKDIHEKMSRLYTDWDKLSTYLATRQENIQDSLVQLEQQHKDLQEVWKKKYGPLRKWITTAQARLNKEYAIAPDLDSVKKQRKDIENFQAEKQSHTPEMNGITQMSDNILKGPQVNEEEKTVIQEEMQELQHGWNELEESMVWKQNRIEDTIRKLENQREDKLRKWQEGLHDVNPWINKTLEKISPEPELSNDVDSAYDQIDDFQNYVRDAPIYQDKVTSLNEFSSNLLTDPCLGEDERQKVGKEMADCNEKWNKLVNIANLRQSRLEKNLAKLEQQQNDDYNRWTIRSGRASELLDKFESQLPSVDKPLAMQLEEVEKQEREFDVFANQVELNETQMNDTFDLGDGIIQDTKNSKAKRDGVQGQLNLLTSRWDRIKDFVDLRKARLEETAKRLRDNRKRKVEKWEETTNEFDLFLSAAERDIRSSDTIGEDLATVKKHNEEFKAAMSKVRSQKRKVFEYGQYTDDVIADPQLDAVSRDHIKIEKEARIDRWGHIEDMINSQQAKLKDKLQELEKGQVEMGGWKNRLNTVNNNISHLERVNDTPVGRDQDTIEKQRQDVKVLNAEKESVEEQVSGFLTYSEVLMDKPGINTENRRHIDKECDALELRWHKAKGELERREKSLDEKQDSLNRRQKNLLSEWDVRKTEVSDWLTDTSTKLKSQDSAVTNVDAVRDQSQKLQHIRKDIVGYEKHVRHLEDFADTLILEPGIHSSEKGLVTREKQSIRERWESLNTAAHNVQKKLSSKVDQLEGEQGRKINDWRRQSGPLDSWLNGAETEVEAYEPVAYDIPMVEKQRKENQSIVKQVERQKPKFDQLGTFANKLTSETFISLEEKVKIQGEMESLQDRLENVDDDVTKRQADIESRLGELQEEERLRRKEEDVERQRRDEERKQRDIDRKKKDEEERQRREQEERERLEEEQRRREYEEKKRQDERERQRQEEERRRREEEEEKRRKEEQEKRAEEERKRKEEEQKKYTILYEPRLSKSIEQEIMVQHEEVVESLQDSPDNWNDPFTEAEGLSRQDLNTWRDDADNIRQWMKRKEGELDDESDDEDIVGLKQHRKEMTQFENEVVEYEPKYEDVKTRHETLMDNEYLNADDKQSLDEDMDDIKTRWDKMSAAKDLKLKRLEDKIGQKEKKKLDDLIDCRADIKNLNDWITNKNNQFLKFEPVAEDLPTLLVQRSELKQFSKEIADKDPQFNGVIKSAKNLSKDPTLSPDESEVMLKEAKNCEQRWDALNDKVKDRVDNLVTVLPAVQKKQKRLMDDWDDKLDRFKKSIKKSENTLDDQQTKWPADVEGPVPKVDLTDELSEKVEQNETIQWRPVVDISNERLAKKRVRLQRIQREKRNRKWSILETIKGMFGFGKKPKKTGVNLDNLIVHLEDHEDLMQEVSSLQRPANEMALSCNELSNSDSLEKVNVVKIDSDMRNVNQQWNQLNVNVIERENRLEQLAQEIEDEYEGFDAWREKCESMNQFLNECQKLQKEEDKIGSDMKTLQEQSQDCKDFKNEVDEFRPQAEDVFQTSHDLIDGGKLDKSDTEGVEHTRDALKKRWDGINDHLKTRQESIDGKLLDMMKEDADGRLWRWRDQSWKLETKITDAHRKLNSDVDETDFVAIHRSAVELESLQSAMDDVFSDHNDISGVGRDLVDAKNLHPHEEDEVNEAISTLNLNLGKIEQSTKDKKMKIKDANKKYFARSLSNMNKTVGELEERVNQDFADVGANIDEVEKQRANIEKFEEQIVSEEDKIEDLKTKLQESKDKGLVDDDDEAEILDEISKLEDKYARINHAHDNNKKRLTQTLIVLHEELIEEINDWLKDTENQVDSITIHTDDLKTLKDDHNRHNELKEEISSFEPTFKRTISLSKKLLDDNVVDEERAESYNNEMKSLNERMDVVNLKMMDNGTKFSNAFAMYLITRLDDAEVSLTQAESRLDQDDKGYVDLEAVKKQLEISKTTVDEVNETKKDVDDIIDEADSLVDSSYFKKHEQDHFKPRVEKIGARNEAMAEKADTQQKRLFDTYIILLRQHLGKMDAWLFKAEEKMRSTEEIKSGYDRVNEQLEEHQKFQDEIREHSMVSIILELDITDPEVNKSVQSQVKSLSERWAALWRWSEERRARLLRLLTNWQKFRDEQIALLNWLSAKEKVLKDMGTTNLSNEEEVNKHLDILKKLQANLDEQGLKLQELHGAGQDLLKDVNNKDKAKSDIKQQLDEFDECWNDIAKQVIERIHTLETSQSKLVEYHSEMDAVVQWMDETEEILGSFKVDMPSEEATRLQGKLDIKCDERSKYQVRVDRINRHGKDLQGTVDQPSYDFINDELKPFNQRWGNLSEQLETLSDKGYPTPGKSDCCLVRIVRQKLGICQ